MAKTMKKRSQAPVALVYFLTLLLALSLAGGVSYYLLKKYEVFKPTASDSKKDSTRVVSILFARVEDTGDFKDLCVMRIDPFNKVINIIPQTDVTKTSDGRNYKEILKSGGMDLLKNKVSETLGGISIEYYATVTNSAFEQVADLLGEMTYKAPQEFYYISQESSKDDISLQKGDLVTLSGRQIVNLASYDIFNDKKAGNLMFLSGALEQVINNGFRQATVTKDNLYNIYEIITTGSNTNLTKDAFNEIRRYLEVMLDERDIPARSLAPQGSWNSDFTAFTMKNDYISQVCDKFGVRKEAAVTSVITEPPAKSPDENTSGK
jgi:hypothetical protein